MPADESGQLPLFWAVKLNCQALCIKIIVHYEENGHTDEPTCGFQEISSNCHHQNLVEWHLATLTLILLTHGPTEITNILLPAHCGSYTNLMMLNESR